MPALSSASPSVALVKVRKAAEITVPAAISDAARLKEGDLLEAEVTEAGTTLLRPVGIAGREPTAEEEAEILAAVDEARAARAEPHR